RTFGTPVEEQADAKSHEPTLAEGYHAAVADTPEPATGVVIPDTDGVRSTSALGRAVVADALRTVDPVGARSAESATVWRRDYLLPFRRLVEAGLLSREGAVAIARDGLASLHRRMRFATPDGELPLAHACTVDPGGDPLVTATVTGKGSAERELVLPYH